jgi:hypothetical protein
MPATSSGSPLSSRTSTFPNTSRFRFVRRTAREHAVSRQAAARADPAVQFVEVSLGPAFDKIRMLGDYIIDDGLGRPVQMPLQQKGRLQKQLVNGDAKALSELVECLRMGPCSAVQNASYCPPIDTGLLGDSTLGPAVARHQAAETGGAGWHGPDYAGRPRQEAVIARRLWLFYGCCRIVLLCGSRYST